MAKKHLLHTIALWLTLIGALTIGTVGLFNFNIFTAIFSGTLLTILEVLVGLSAIMVGYKHLM